MNRNDGAAPSSDLLRTFLVLARTGNVTIAADELGRTQSAISVQLRRLEEDLGERLFERGSRGIDLTDAGRRLLPAARRALRELDRVGGLFANPLAGRVRIGIPDDYGDAALELALAEFGRRHVDVEVFARSGCSGQFPEQIERGELDLAVYSAPPTDSRHAFFTEPTVWVAGADFQIDTTLPIPLARFDRECWWRSVPTDALDSADISWRDVYLSENFTSVVSAIRAGLGIGILARGLVGEGLRVLGANDGLPDLPCSTLVLLKRPGGDERLISAMEQAIHGAILSSSRP